MYNAQCINIIKVNVKFNGNPYREILFLLHSFMIFIDSSIVWKGPFSASLMPALNSSRVIGSPGKAQLPVPLVFIVFVFIIRKIKMKNINCLISQATDRNYQNTILTTISPLTSGYDHQTDHLKIPNRTELPDLAR